ncbi:MAG: GAF domain-containing sensor histidine kinase [Anaerolineales bacterium]|nr:GAF domain-containing sensor histidine kinase [Anaerolineales bacterium]
MSDNQDLLNSVSAEQGRLAALYRVSQSLGTTLDLGEVLNQVMDLVIDLTGAERGFIMLHDPDTGELDLQAARNIDHANLDQKDIEVSRSVIQAVLRDGNGVALTDARRDPRFASQDSIVLYALRSIMCAPLRARGSIIGVVYVDNRAQTGVFDKDELDLLNAFATQAAIAIENARLYTRTDQALSARIAELETLSKIDHDLSAQLDLAKVVEITNNWAKQGTGATHCWLLHRQEDGAFRSLASTLNTGVSTWDVAVDALAQKTLEDGIVVVTRPRDGSLARLASPISWTDGPECVLVVERPEPFSDAARNFLARLTSRASAALQNARLYNAVQEANQAKSKFVSVVTHELRIPMTSIKGYTDLLRQGAVGPVNEMQQNFLGVIRNNVERMSVLVSDLSDISHIETGRLLLKCSLIQLPPCLEETLNSLTPRLDEKDQHLEVHMAPDLPPVFADSNRLVQVLTNLISNANKYTPAGGNISVNISVSGEFVRVGVKDSGIGISEEDQQNLFSQFFRSENPDVREQQGWGLGLNLTKRLVVLMGGEIGAQSTLGQGSTFWFTLPTRELEV